MCVCDICVCVISVCVISVCLCVCEGVTFTKGRSSLRRRRCGDASACVWQVVLGIHPGQQGREVVVHMVFGYAYRCSCSRCGQQGRLFDDGFGEGRFYV